MKKLALNLKRLTIIFVIIVSTNSLFAQTWKGEVSRFYSVAKAVFTVNSTDDTGDSNPGDGICDDGTGNCTLRAAIEEANANFGKDSIAFDIAGTAPYTFQPSGPLPEITDSVIIDGTTEPDFNSAPIIELDGSNAGDAHGLHINSGNCTIKSLVINRFNWNGINLSGNGNNIVEGNYIGIDISGANALGNGNAGVMIETSGNTIGGTTLEARNIISGNLEGVTFPDDPNATDNYILGNFIGTDVNGTTALSNSVGILLLASGNTIGGSNENAGNLISGNTNSGINIEFVGGVEASNNTIIGNFIGTDVNGTAALSNNEGIYINSGASENIIGGTNSEERNLISGNVNKGILISNIGTDNNIIQGNYIGTDVTGLISLPNSSDGITINDGASNNKIGGVETGAGNLISGNGRYGITIGKSGTTGNIIQGNYIGTDLTGNSDLGNGREGVCFWSGAAENLIGGDETEAGNIIAFNSGGGILVSNTITTYQNTISRNSIFSNIEIGIDLSIESVSPYRDGITLNDVGDGDTGPNNLQNFPVFYEVEIDNGNLLIKYNVDSDPVNSTYPIIIQFFKADDEGEGGIYLGSDTFSETDFSAGSKTANLGSADELEISNDDLIVATATDSEGNTSEFSSTEIEDSLSVIHIFNNSFEIYPNPNSGTFYLKLDNPQNEYYYLEIFNSNGQKVYERNISNRIEIHEEINITGKGIYLLKIHSLSKVLNRKIIIY